MKPIGEQVMIITGASSGIGLATARRAAKLGAHVILTSRDAADLEAAVEGIRAEGGDAIFIDADVADKEGMERVAESAMGMYGRIDTWVNNAGVSIYGRLEQVTLEDAHRLFETNYWGLVNGSLTALRHMKEKGGAIINVGSVLSDRSILLQGHYSASKHAVKGFTDALRMEIEKDGYPIAVTLVKPTSIATPYIDHARNLMDEEATVPPPVYDPSIVAETIIACAQKPVREIVVGGGGKMITAGGLFPRVMDLYMEKVAYEQQRTGEPRDEPRRDNLYNPNPGTGSERGSYGGYVFKRSFYTTAALHPMATVLGMAALGASVLLAARLRS